MNRRICLSVRTQLGPACPVVNQVKDTYEPSWDWNSPDWSDINNQDTSAVGFVYGDGLTDEKATLDEFIAGLAAGALGEGRPEPVRRPMNLGRDPVPGRSEVATEKRFDMARGADRRPRLADHPAAAWKVSGRQIV